MKSQYQIKSELAKMRHKLQTIGENVSEVQRKEMEAVIMTLAWVIND